MTYRTDIELDARGTTLRGWLYRPDGVSDAPLLIMAHGCSAVKEMYLDCYGEAFAEAGLAALIYDRRNLGASDGEPRREVDPVADVADYCAAVTFAHGLSGIDQGRMVLWGTSYGGAVVLAAAAIEPRVRAVVAQVPILAPARAVPRAIEDALARDPSTRIPVCTPDPTQPALLPTPDAWAFKLEVEARAPSWRNDVTLRSLANLAAWDGTRAITRLGNTPALVLIAEDDLIIPAVHLRALCAGITGPKRVVELPGGHFDAYDPKRPQFATAIAATCEFVRRAVR